MGCGRRWRAVFRCALYVCFSLLCLLLCLLSPFQVSNGVGWVGASVRSVAGVQLDVSLGVLCVCLSLLCLLLCLLSSLFQVSSGVG